MIVEASGFTPNGYLPPDFDVAANKGDACTMAVFINWYPVQYMDNKGERCFVFYDDMQRLFYFLSFTSWDKVAGKMVLSVESTEKHHHHV